MKLVGLNVPVHNGAMSNHEVVERNWVFWSLFCQVGVAVENMITNLPDEVHAYIQDKCWSLYVGRDQGLRYSQLDIPEPEVDLVPHWDRSTPGAHVLDKEANPMSVARASTQSVSFLWQVRLMKISSSIMDVVYGTTGVSRGGIDLAQVTKLQWGQFFPSWKPVLT